MLHNSLKITIRNLAGNKAVSFINIFGLAAGLATCLLIMVYIFDESSYDKHHKDGKNIFRIASTSKGDTWAALPAPVAAALKNDLPEVTAATRLMTFPDIAKMIIRNDAGKEKKQFIESNGYYADSNFFQVLTYDFIHGKEQTALLEPNSMVISEEMAEKFFGKENPLDKPLVVNTPFGEFNYTVKGVFRTSSHKSHIPANFFLSMHNNDMWKWVQNQTAWGTNNVFFTYVKANAGTNPKVFEKKVNAFFQQHAGKEIKAAGFAKTLFLQPLESIYLHSSVGNEIGANGNIIYLYILGSIAIFILIIACINFMNLSTARAEKRAKEVGVRKVVGAGKGSLIWQFLGESFLLCLISLVLALIMVLVFMPLFNQLTGKAIHPFGQPSLVFWIIGLALFTGLLSGLYPAFYLSAFKPVSILKGKIANSFSATAIRKGLVVFQFTVSVCLMLGAIVIWKQLDYLRNKQLGFNQNQKIVLPLQTGYLNSEKNYNALKNELVKYPEVRSVSSGSTYPGIPNLNDMLFYADGKTINENVDVGLCIVEKEYIETLGFQLVAGRSFSETFKADSMSIIMNETAIKELGYNTETAVGKKVNFDFGKYHSSFQIVGVVKDFNHQSLHTAIRPYAFLTGYFGGRYGYVIADVSTNNYAGLMKKIENTWTKINPAVPFTYSFIDQDFERNYGKEQLTSRIVVSFTCIAILIACLGLFGLAAFSASQRTKEIGIRKVLGASVTNVMALLSRDFLRLVLVAIVIASPLAWYVMNKWLQEFAYRTDISWWIFIVAGSMAVVIALLTVSFQAIRSAVANPVKSLRTE